MYSPVVGLADHPSCLLLLWTRKLPSSRVGARDASSSVVERDGRLAQIPIILIADLVKAEVDAPPKRFVADFISGDEIIAVQVGLDEGDYPGGGFGEEARLGGARRGLDGWDVSCSCLLCVPDEEAICPLIRGGTKGSATSGGGGTHEGDHDEEQKEDVINHETLMV